MDLMPHGPAQKQRILSLHKSAKQNVNRSQRALQLAAGSVLRRLVCILKGRGTGKKCMAMAIQQQ